MHLVHTAISAPMASASPQFGFSLPAGAVESIRQGAMSARNGVTENLAPAISDFPIQSISGPPPQTYKDLWTQRQQRQQDDTSNPVPINDTFSLQNTGAQQTLNPVQIQNSQTTAQGVLPQTQGVPGQNSFAMPQPTPTDAAFSKKKPEKEEPSELTPEQIRPKMDMDKHELEELSYGSPIAADSPEAIQADMDLAEQYNKIINPTENGHTPWNDTPDKHSDSIYDELYRVEGG